VNKPANPFQTVIDWLRSDEGQQWSEDRMREARFGYRTDGRNYYEASIVSYSVATTETVYLKGVLSVKED
jgi:hypothetical protein